MAVYTDITNAELTAFLSDYNIGSLKSYRGIAEGVENSNFMLHTSEGIYILTLYEKRVDENDLPFFLGLMDHQAKHGINCPLPIARRDGALVSHLAGRAAAIISFLDGIWVRKPQADHCKKLGVALAEFHLAGQNFSLKRPNTLGQKDWSALWAECAPSADQVASGLEAEIATDMAKFDQHWPQNLPEGVIHADLFPDNVFFLDDTLSGMIDFYFACNDQFAYDLAICLNAWCFEKDGSYNRTKGQSLIAGYQSARILTEDEVEALPILAHGASMRFFLTRLYDWIHTPEGSLVVKKDPMEYLRFIRFHRAITTAEEYGYQQK